MESREAEMQAVIRTRERELRCALEEALSARQEVEAKTAQVKEYKAQVRGSAKGNTTSMIILSTNGQATYVYGYIGVIDC